MTALGIDLGGTKLSLAVFTEQGNVLFKRTIALEKREGKEVSDLVAEELRRSIRTHQNIQSIGIAVPGIYRNKTGTVWAPNIK
jgi:glucokinase